MTTPPNTIHGGQYEILEDKMVTTYRTQDSEDGKRKAGEAFVYGVLVVRDRVRVVPE